MISALGRLHVRGFYLTLLSKAELTSEGETKWGHTVETIPCNFFMYD